MSASVARPPVRLITINGHARSSDVRQAFRASLKVKPGESELCAALAEAELQIDSIRRVINFRVDHDADAATHTMLDDIRRIGGNLMAAADEYQNGGAS